MPQHQITEVIDDDDDDDANLCTFLKLLCHGLQRKCMLLDQCFFFLIWNLFEIYQLFNIEKNAISICSTDIRKYSSYF